MSEWSLKFSEEIDPDFAALGSLFKTGWVKKMISIKEQAPTKVALLLGMNYNTYQEKLRNPHTFTIKHINLMAYAFRIDPDLIHNVIQKEILKDLKEAFQKYEDKVEENRKKLLK